MSGRPKVCDGVNLFNEKDVKGCKGLCTPIISFNRPSSSEWYCGTCHTSYSMEPQEYTYYSQRQQAPQQ